jgi:hypothetical protein
MKTVAAIAVQRTQQSNARQQGMSMNYNRGPLLPEPGDGNFEWN